MILAHLINFNLKVLKLNYLYKELYHSSYLNLLVNI